jgi:hypothetical protein
LGRPEATPNINREPAAAEPNHLLERDLAACKRSIPQNGYGTFGVDHYRHAAPDQCAMHSHASLKACCETIPLAVFLGGTPQKSHVMVFNGH